MMDRRGDPNYIALDSALSKYMYYIYIYKITSSTLHHCLNKYIYIRLPLLPCIYIVLDSDAG
jgi:hypothetical protein